MKQVDEPVSPSQLIIIGDTPRDIAAARQGGTRVLSVATGAYTLEQLKAEHPDATVTTLEDTRPLDELIQFAQKGHGATPFPPPLRV